MDEMVPVMVGGAWRMRRWKEARAAKEGDAAAENKKAVEVQAAREKAIERTVESLIAGRLIQKSEPKE